MKAVPHFRSNKSIYVNFAWIVHGAVCLNCLSWKIQIDQLEPSVTSWRIARVLRNSNWWSSLSLVTLEAFGFDKESNVTVICCLFVLSESESPKRGNCILHIVVMQIRWWKFHDSTNIGRGNGSVKNGWTKLNHPLSVYWKSKRTTVRWSRVLQ